MSAPSHKYFKGPEEFHLMSEALASVMSVLNIGRTGDVSTSVHASAKGYRIAVGRSTFARGKTPEELLKNFRAAVAEGVAKQETAKPTARLTA